MMMEGNGLLVVDGAGEKEEVDGWLRFGGSGGRDSTLVYDKGPASYST